jgi:hypothetical protein
MWIAQASEVQNSLHDSSAATNSESITLSTTAAAATNNDKETKHCSYSQRAATDSHTCFRTHDSRLLLDTQAASTCSPLQQFPTTVCILMEPIPPPPPPPDKIEELQRKNEELQKQLKESQENARKLFMVIEINSLYTALTRCPNMELVCTGSDTSHLRTSHVKCEAIPKTFGLNSDFPRSALPDLQTSLSLLLTKWNTHNLSKDTHNLSKPFTYSNEADVANLVCSALEDAVSAFERITQSNGKLAVRCEASLFSNRLDLAVVYDTLSGAPVLVVEVKKPHNKLETSPSVYGQIHDYLFASAAFGSAHPFAVLTSFAETWVCWTENDESNDIANNVQDRFNGLNLATGEGSPATPSPPKLVEMPCTPQDTEEQANSIKASTRVVCKSDMFESNELVLVLCNAIACGLKNFNPVQRIRKLTSGDVVTQDVMSFTQTGFSCKHCQITVKGHRSTVTYIPSYITSRTYYAIGILGRGATSIVFHAIDSTGAECAIKMYIARYDDGKKKYLDAAKFRSNAIMSVNKEVANYRTIYPELRNVVYRRTLNNLQCVIMPVFLPIQTERRLACLPKVGDVLGKFREKRLSYNRSDRAWRHVGTLDEQVYLFDLAELKKDSSEQDASENATQHVEALRGKCNDTTIGDAANNPPLSAKRIRLE